MPKIPTILLNQIQTLNYDQLHELYHIIIQRLRLLRNASNIIAMRHFNLFDKVYFDYQNQRYYGQIERINQKTISIIEDSTQSRWRIAPQLITKILPSEDIYPEKTQITQLIQQTIQHNKTKKHKHKKARKKRKKGKKR